MPKYELTFNYSVTELSNVDVWDGNGLYTSCTKLQRTDKTLIYQHIIMYRLIIHGFFPQWKKKKQCVSFETLYWEEISCNYSLEQLQIQELHQFCKKSKTPDSIIWVLAPLMHGPCLYSVLVVSSLASDYHL